MADADALLPVLKIQRFSTHDGPSIRTAVYTKGCPLRCAWCHNPESQSCRPEIFYAPALCIGCGACASVCPSAAHNFEDGAHHFDRSACTRCLQCCAACPAGALEAVPQAMTAAQILHEVNKDADFYGRQGGMTLTGGEPMLHVPAALRLMHEAKKSGINVAVETCGYFDPEYIQPLADTADLVMWDVKDADPERHKKYTGVSNEKILENLYAFDNIGGRTILRCIMLRGINTDVASLDKIAHIFCRLKNCLHMEIFSYRHHGEGKYTALGREYYGKAEWSLSANELKKISTYLKANCVKCRIA